VEIYLYLIRPISACKFSNWDWAGYTAARNCNIDIVALIIQKGSSEVKSWNRIIDGAIEGEKPSGNKYGPKILYYAY